MKKKKKRSAGKGLYRDRDKLVIREGATFPARCAICNKESDVEPVEFTFARDKAHYVEVAAVQAVARAAHDLMRGARYTGPVRTEIPLCSWHRARRLRLAGIGVGLVVLGIGFLLIRKAMGVTILPPGELGFLQISLPHVIAIGAACAGIVLAMCCVFDSSKLWFKAEKYHDRFVWVKGAGRAFLRELPEIKDQHKDPHHDPGADNPELSAEELIRRAGGDDDD